MKDKFIPRRDNSNGVRRMVSAISMRGNIDKRGNQNYLRPPRENCNPTYAVLPAWTPTLNPFCYSCYNSNT
jgi:hypothetical protein